MYVELTWAPCCTDTINEIRVRKSMFKVTMDIISNSQASVMSHEGFVRRYRYGPQEK